MPLSIWFWLLMAVWLLFGFYWNWNPARPNYQYGLVGGNLLLFLLLLIIGLHDFGSPIH